MADQRIDGRCRVGLWSGYLLLGALAVLGTGCGQLREPSAMAQPQQGQGDRPVVVDIATAESAGEESRVYTGTTRPSRQVSLRSQAEGRLLSLSLDVGDAVQQGQVVGTLDSTLLQTSVGEAQAELAARQFEVTRSEAELADIRTSIEDARVQLQQARNDFQRLEQLASQGAVAAQEAERAQTEVRVAEQALRSAEEQVRTRQQSVSAAQQRVEAQRAILRQNQERLTFSNLNAPLSGIVLERLVEPGDLVLPGDAVLSLGDLSEIQVMIEVADSNLSDFNLGQPAQVRFDAIPGEVFSGSVTRISPVADGTSRLLPVEITLSNPGGRIGSGLLARVTSAPGGTTSAITVPQSALSEGSNGEDQVFVVTESGEGLQVEARSVRVGDRSDGQATILAGLASGDRYVVRSSQPLESGQIVEPSLLSES